LGAVAGAGAVETFGAGVVAAGVLGVAGVAGVLGAVLGAVLVGAPGGGAKTAALAALLGRAMASTASSHRAGLDTDA
jgi:hypothetical protein